MSHLFLEKIIKYTKFKVLLKIIYLKTFFNFYVAKLFTIFIPSYNNSHQKHHKLISETVLGKIATKRT